MSIIRRIFGTLVLIGGIALIGLFAYAEQKIEKAKAKTSEAQSKVDENSSSIRPLVKKRTKSAQTQIDTANQTLTGAADIAKRYLILGIILTISGTILILIPKKKK